MTNLITEARELIEALHAGEYDDEYIGTDAYLMLDELCNALEKADAEIDRLSLLAMMRESEIGDRDREIERLRWAQRWIPVTERLPKTEKPVQVYMPKLYMSVQTGFYTKYYGEDDGEWYEHWVASGDVTHWRELPAPPEEGAEHE